MHARVSPHRGPRPWARSRTGADRIQLVAAIELVVLAAWAAWLGFVTVYLADVRFCMDSDEAACYAPSPPTAYYVAVVVACAGVAAVAAVALLLARAHRHGRVSRFIALVGLVPPLLIAHGVTSIFV